MRSSGRKPSRPTGDARVSRGSDPQATTLLGVLFRLSQGSGASKGAQHPGPAYPYRMMLRATSPRSRRSKAVLISSKVKVRDISSSSFSLPARYKSTNLGMSARG